MKNNNRIIIAFFFLLFLSICANKSFAQIPLGVDLYVVEPYPTKYALWAAEAEGYFAIVTNNTDIPFEYYLNISLNGYDNNFNPVSITISDDFVPSHPLLIGPNETVHVSAQDITDRYQGLENFLITENVPLNLDGELPSGTYQLCTSARAFPENPGDAIQIFSDSFDCSEEFVVSQNNITLEFPQDGYVVENNGNDLNVQWSSISSLGESPGDQQYVVRLYELDSLEAEQFSIYDMIRDGSLPAIYTGEPTSDWNLFYNQSIGNVPLVDGFLYAAQVEIVELDGAYFENNFSNINAFWYGHDPTYDISTETDQDGDGINDEMAECYENINYTEEISSNNASDPSSFSEFKIGFHTIHSLENIETSGDEISGEGVITLPFLGGVKLAVEFTNIKVNNEGRVYSGVVTARDDSQGTYDTSELADAITSGEETISGDDATAVSDLIYNGERVADLIAGKALGVPLGYKGDLKGTQFDMAITQLEFFPDKALGDIVTLLDFSGMFEKENFIVAMGASDVTIIPDGFGAEYTLHPTANVVWELPGIDMKMYGMNTDDNAALMDSASYLKLNCEGLESFAFRGEILFPRDVLVPDDDGSIGEGKAAASFGYTVEKDPAVDSPYFVFDAANLESKKATHIMMNINMNRFQIAGLDGWGFELLDGYLDMSEKENPEGMEFPENYIAEGLMDEDDEVSRFWQGLYLRDINIYPPEKFYEQPESTEGTIEAIAPVERFGVGIHNFIFDNSLSVDFQALNLVDKGKDNINGWGISLDTLKLSILQNTFEEGRLSGSINTPITGTEDYIYFGAVIDQDEEKKFRFHAIATPQSSVSLPLLFADAGLCPNSFVSFSTDPDDELIEAFLKGQININVTEKIGELVDMDLSSDIIPDLNISLADFQINFNSADGFVQDVSDGTGTTFGFGLDFNQDCCGPAYSGPIWESSYTGENTEPPAPSSSEQETLGGFPITFNDFSISDLGLEEIGFDFDLDVNFLGDEEAFGGELHMNLLSELNLLEGGLKTFKPNWPTVTGIGLYYEKTPVVFNGDIQLVNNEDGSTGFHGDLELGLDMKAGEFNISLKAGYERYGSPDGEDGSSSPNEFGTEEYHGWWYVDGIGRWSPGIPAFPPYLYLNGFGGGVYWNCEYGGNLDLEDVIMAQEGTGNGIVDMDIEDIPEVDFGRKTLVFKSSMSIINDKFIMLDSDNSLSWGGADNTFELGINGQIYLFAPSYSNRDAAWLSGQSFNSLIFQKESGNNLQAAYIGQTNIYLNVLGGLISGAGADGMLGSMGMAMASEQLFPHPSNGDSDNIFWYNHAGNPYDENVGPMGIKLDIAELFGNPDAEPKEEEDSSDNDGGSDVGVSAELALTTYFMMGQGLPSVLPEPGPYLEEFGGTSTSSEGTFNSGGLDEEGRDPAAASTGQGFIMGLGLEAHAEIKAVIYASLSIFAGIDMMMVKDESRVCIMDHEVVDDIGIDGWYANGRAYAGLKGAVGAKGKLFGKEIDVKVMELSAGMMLDAGGIEPTWLDGRADLSYNLLGGIIKGNARMNIEVGNKCEIPVLSPFDFPIIAESYPEEGMPNLDNMDPFIEPTVSFTIPINEYITVVDVNERSHTVKPVIKTFTLDIASNNTQDLPSDISRDLTYDMVSRNGRTATYNPMMPLARINGNNNKSTWKMIITVQARGADGKLWKDSFGKVWEETREVTFRTTALPPYISEMGKTVPNENQKFFLQGELEGDALLHTASDLSEAYFYPVKSGSGQTCSYFAQLKNADTHELVLETKVSYNAIDRKLRFPLPKLKNEQSYYYQIIRRFEGGAQSEKADKLRELDKVEQVASADEYDASNSYTISTQTELLDPKMAVGFGEILLYMYSFKTSAHDLLGNKMASVNIEADKEGSYDLLTVSGFEGFDMIDIYGYNSPEGNAYDSPARVDIEDLLNSPLFTGIGADVLGTYWENMYDEYIGEETGCYEDIFGPTDLPNGVTVYDLENEDGNNNNIENQAEPTVGDADGDGINDFADEVPIPYASSINGSPNRLNYTWHAPNTFTEVLNDDIIDGLVSVESAGNTMLQASYSNADIINTFMANNNDLEIKYYVTEKVLEDAVISANHGFYWESLTMGYEGYHQTLHDITIHDQLVNLRYNLDVILESKLHSGGGFFTGGNLSNRVRFRANKSYENGELIPGSAKEVDFYTQAKDIDIEGGATPTTLSGSVTPIDN